MTDEEYKRLRELDNLIAWNNETDGGRDLTEEEKEEHSRLFWKAMQEYEEGKAKNGKEGL